jgi:hypothetical protein
MTKEKEIKKLEDEIKMIRSHQNESNYFLLEDMISARILLIMELQGVKIEEVE